MTSARRRARATTSSASHDSCATRWRSRYRFRLPGGPGSTNADETPAGDNLWIARYGDCPPLRASSGGGSSSTLVNGLILAGRRWRAPGAGLRPPGPAAQAPSDGSVLNRAESSSGIRACGTGHLSPRGTRRGLTRPAKALRVPAFPRSSQGTCARGAPLPAVSSRGPVPWRKGAEGSEPDRVPRYGPGNPRRLVATMVAAVATLLRLRAPPLAQDVEVPTATSRRRPPAPRPLPLRRLPRPPRR